MSRHEVTTDYDEGIVCSDCGAHEPFGHYDDDEDVTRCDACHDWVKAQWLRDTRRAKETA